MHMYLEYHSVPPLVGIGTPTPNPSPASECALPPGTKGGGGGGGTRSPAYEGVGEFQCGRLERKLSTLSSQCLVSNTAKLLHNL